MQDKYQGMRLDGRYELLEVIGIGGMATVYKAMDITENRLVAVKVLKDEYAENEDFVRRFINEARAISVLNHINIVKVFDASVSQTVKYMVMEYIEGITLKEYIARKGKLSWKDTVFFAVQILRALQHAHDKGIVHRDIKPQNIMLLVDGTAKVMDFGIARFSRSGDHTITDKAIGSVHYISPEQARGEPTDEKADIYSVGVIMYEMLTGKLPFDAESAVSVAVMQLQSEPKRPTAINPEIPLGAEQITLHAMRKDVLGRYQSAAEMLHDLEEFRRDPDMTFDFVCFVDDSPTRFVDISQEPKTIKKENTDNTTDESNRSVFIPILTGITAAFVIAAIVIGSIFAYSIFGNKTTGHTVVDFTGHTYESVIKNYGNVFTFEKKDEYSSDYPAGIVIAQSKAEGQRVKKTQKIVLTISIGVQQTEVPQITGKTVAEAKPLIDMANLVYEIEYAETTEYPTGSIIVCQPSEGSVVNAGTVVKLIVAQQPGIQNVELPNVVKNSIASAKKILETKGLKLNGDPISIYSNGYSLEGKKLKNISKGLPSGYVAGQSPSPTTEAAVPKGTAVELYVSNGQNYYSYNIKVDLADAIVNTDKAKIIAKLNGKKIGESESFKSKAKKTELDVSFLTAYDFADKDVSVELFIVEEDDSQHLYQIVSIVIASGKQEVIFQN
ncbi:MAG: Stk1 family PASTA domain-containing Ser/Thr kinase [Clostridia bacterium]|nr:Stk1 family PASTA domain-containing Ser/Thr kinase [Clostridia bacterium]